MSVIAHLDCSTGVSGDKFLGALLDAGQCGALFTSAHLQELLSQLAPEARVVTQCVTSHGVSAISVRVETTEEPPSRTWAQIRAMLESAALPNPVRATAAAAFAELAEAEACAHGVAVEDVHFHEVGAIDSILDIVGVAFGVHALGIEYLAISPLALGWGTVATSHGVLGVPAPATARLVEAIPTQPGPSRPDGTAPGELTTPTGAALARVLANAFGPCPPITPRLLGYGAGTRDLGMPNVCRLVVGEAADSPLALGEETVARLEANIDHISPEAASVSAEQLLAEGVLDVWITPTVMKKGRASFVLEALVPLEEARHFAERFVALTGSLGVRVSEQPRFVAERTESTVETAYGPVRVKTGAGRVRPEADDIARIARQTGRSFIQIAEELGAAIDPTTSRG